jgi:hypothetical protein
MRTFMRVAMAILLLEIQKESTECFILYAQVKKEFVLAYGSVGDDISKLLRKYAYEQVEH